MDDACNSSCKTTIRAAQSITELNCNKSQGLVDNFAFSVSLPLWTADETSHRHLWYDTTASGDWCHVNESECLKSGPRKKCAACKIIIHKICMPKLQCPCKPTFREASSSNYRDRNNGTLSVKHHWVQRRQEDNKCQACGKWIQTKFSFKDTIYLQCNWCRVCFHNIQECFKPSLLTTNCSLGVHANLIIPPTWIVKIPEPIIIPSSVRRSPSNPAFTVGLNKLNVHKSQLMVSSSVDLTATGLTKMSTHLRCVEPCLSLSALSLPTTAIAARPVSAVTCEFPFVIKPNPKCLRSNPQSPLIVFINPKAGGNQGVKMIKTFQWLLNPRQVFSLGEGGPRLGLELFGRLPNVRILVCGGDGTVGWILSEIDALGIYPTPPVAILPLGTGNDLSRTLNWGPGYTDESISKILTSVEEGRIVALDRWSIISKPLSLIDVNTEDQEESTESTVVNKLPLNVINNYFSLGADAAAALEFHTSREANPDRFNSRLKNKIFYAGIGGMDVLKRSWKDLSDYVTLICDGVDMSPKLLELRPHILLFLNIPKYSGGTVPWGNRSNDESPQKIDDKHIEVVALTSTSLVKLQMGGHGERICQCSEATLTTKKTIPMQVDGEPCRLGPSILEIKLRNRACLIQKARRSENGSPSHVPIPFGGPLVNTYILFPDGGDDPEDLDQLCKTAYFFSILRIRAQSDLISVRRMLSERDSVQLESRINEKLGHALPKNWIFLDMTAINGKVFGIDPKLESEYFITDILSNNNELFLISIEYEKSSELHISVPNANGFDKTKLDCLQSAFNGVATFDEQDEISKKNINQSKKNGILVLRMRSLEERSTSKMHEIGFPAHCSSCPDLRVELVEPSPEVMKCPAQCPNKFSRKWRREAIRVAKTRLRVPKPRPGWGFPPARVQSLSSLQWGQFPASETTRYRSRSTGSNDNHCNHLREELPKQRRKKFNHKAYYLSACKYGRLNEVRKSLEAGISPLTTETSSGRSGLHISCKFGRLEVVRLLLELGPKELLELPDYEKHQTALHKAAMYRRRRICEALISAGASVVSRDLNGQTPCLLALKARDNRLAHLLQKEEMMQIIANGENKTEV